MEGLNVIPLINEWFKKAGFKDVELKRIYLGMISILIVPKSIVQLHESKHS